MNVYSRFWNWLKARRAGQSPTVPLDHSAKLSLRKLEDRQVLSVSAVLAGLDVTFSGDDGGASADSIVFTIDNNGNLAHNLGGTNGFNSNIDLDNTVAGDQSLAVADLANLTVQLGADTDSIDFAADFNFASGNLLIEADSITAVGHSLTVQGLTTFDAGASHSISLTGMNDFNTVQILSGNHVTLNDVSGVTFHGASHVSGDLTITALGAVSDDASSSLIVDGVADLTGTSIDLGNATDDHMEFGSLSFHSTGDVHISEDSNLTVSGASTAGNLTLVASDDVNFDATVNVTGNTSVTAGTTDGGIGIHAKLTSSGSILLDAADEIVISADIDPTIVTLEADDDITISASVAASDLISISAGQDGTGSVVLSSTGLLTADNAGNTANITIQTGTTSGNVTLTGKMTADDLISITAAGAINGAGLATAQTVDLHAGSGIGNTTALQLAATAIQADSTTGNIDISNTAAAASSTFDITAGSGNVNLRNANAMEIQGSITGNLTATATSGNLSDYGLLTITGTSSFTTSQSNAGIEFNTLAATGAVTLSTAGTTGNATIVNATALALQGTVRGNLAATATTGNLTDSNTLTVTGTSQFTTSEADADIDLGTLAATGAVTLNTTGTSGHVNIVNSRALALQGLVTGNLTAIATIGNLTDSALLTVTGSSSFTTSQTNADISLGTLNATGPVAVNTVGTSGNVAIINTKALALEGTVHGTLSATATTGNLTDSNTLTVSGTSSFRTVETNADIELDTLAATGAVTLTTAGTTGNATIINSIALAIRGTVRGNLNANATTGNLTDAANMTVTGTSSFTTSQVDASIDMGTLIATGAVTVNTSGAGGNVNLVNSRALAVQGNVGGNLIARATTGNLTDSSLITVAGTTSLTTVASDADINFGTLASLGAVTLNTVGTSGNASIVNATALALQGTVNGNLTARATTGSLTDSNTLTVTGTSSFTTSEADADIDLGTLAATGAVTLNTTGTSGDANVVNATALALQGTVNGNLSATATTGNLTDSNTLTVTGTSSFATSQADADIDLGTLASTGAVTLNTAGTSGDANIVNATALALQGTVNGNLTARASTGNLTDSNTLTVTGASSFNTNQTNSDIILDTLVATGPVTIGTVGTSGDVTIVNAIALALQGTVRGNLTATATTGQLTDSSTLTVTGTSSFTTVQNDEDIVLDTLASTGNVTLNTAGINGDATVVNAIALALQGTINGQLNATATTGGLSDSDILTVTGSSSFTTSQSNASIYLDTLAATGPVTLATNGTSGNATIVNAIALALQGTVSGDLNATSTTGNLTDSNTLTVTGTSTFTTTEADADIDLDTLAATGTVTLNTTGISGNAQVVNATDLALQGTVNGNLTARTTTGNLSDAGLLTVTGSSSFTTSQDDADVSLDSLTATGPVTVNTSGTSGDVSIINSIALALNGTVNGNLNATATTGDLTDSSTLAVTGTSSFSTTEADADIVLDTLNATGSVTLNTTGTSGHATLVNSTALALQGTVNGGLSASTTSGDLTDSGPLTVTGKSSFTAANDILLDEATNDFTGVVTASGANVLLTDANQIVLGQTTASSLIVNSGARITVGTGIGEDLNVTGAVTLNAASEGVTEAAGSIISAGQLELLGVGEFTLNEANAISTLAANVQGPLSLVNAQSLTVGTVNTTSGIQTSNADVRFDITGDLRIGQVGDLGANDIAAGTGNVTLVVTGSIAETAGNTIAAQGLQVVGGNGAVNLDEANAVTTFAASRTGTISYRDVDGLTIGSVTDTAGLPNTTTAGITTTGQDTKITTGGPLSIQSAVDLGAAGNLTLDVTGTIQQGVGGTVTAAGLALSGGETTTGANLNAANDVDTFASNYQGPVYFADIDDLTIGQITDSAMSGSPTVTGISSTITGFDVSLKTQGNLTVDEDVNLGTDGDFTLDVTGSVTQNAGDTVTANGLQLIGNGQVLLEDAGNDVEVIAINHQGTISYRDANSLAIGTVTDSNTGTSTSGLTNDSDVKLVAGGDLYIDEAVTLAGHDLVLDAAGTITQSGAGTITASGLGIQAGNGATLDQANQVDTLAVDAGGSFTFHDSDGLSIGSVTENASSSPTTVTGIVTSDDNVTISTAAGDLTLLQAIDAGTGSVSLEATTGSIVDGNDGQTLITAGDLSLIAQTNIGDITDFAAGTGNAIDVALSGQLTKASVSDAGGEIFLNFLGDLAAATGSVDVAGANTGSAILRATGGNIDAGTSSGVFTLSSGDNLGLEAIRVGANGGTLTLPDAGLNVGTGDLRLRGDVDIRDAAGRDLGPLVADDLSFISGGSGGATTLNTAVNTITAQVTGSGAALTINESDGLTLTSVSTNDANLIINASQSSAGDITVIDVNAGTGRATLATTANGGGQIIDGDSVDSGTTADITAGEIDLQASTGIGNTNKLEIASPSFAATTATGDINVRGVSGDLTIAALTGGTNGVSITAGAAGDDICVTSTGALNVNADVSNIGTGDRAILLASDGTSATNDLIVSADVTSTGGNGNITLLAGDTISFAGTSTTSASGVGAVQVRAGRVFNDGGAELGGNLDGDITMGDGAVIQSDNGDITLSAPDNIQLSVVNANAAGATGDIFITADADGTGSGAISESLTGEAPNLIGDMATLSAATGIGSAGGSADIDTSIGTLVATNTTSGNIAVHEVNSLVIGGSGVQTQQGNGSVSIVVDNGPLTTNSAVTADGSGTVNLAADTGTVTLNANVTSTNGTITVQGDEVTQAANISTGGTGSVQVTADNGSITMQDGTSTTTTSGEILYQASGDVRISQLQSGSGPLTVTADSDSNDSGAIIDNSSSEAANLITSGTATLQAATGIGHADDIDTTIGTLVATNTTSGDISIQETDGLVIGGSGVQTQGGSGDILIDVDAGSLAVNSAVTADGEGDVTLNADAGSVDLSSSVSSTTGNLIVTADSVNQNAGGDMSTGTSGLLVGTITVTADNGAITMADGTSSATQTGTITYAATADVALGQLSATTGDIRVTAGTGPSTSGAIRDNTAAETPNIVTAGTAVLTAETGIGSGGGTEDIETEVAVLDVTNSTAGDIDITESTSVRVVQLSQTGGGQASLQTTNGTITVSNLNAASNAIVVNDGGALLLDANGGSVIVDDGIQTVGGNITIQADQSVIVTSAPITSVTGNGNISIQAGNNIQILDPGNVNPVDVSVEGTGKVSLIAANQVVLGSQNPTVVSNTTQHTVANDVLIQTSTGSITNVLPLGYNIQAPQILASGKAVLSITIGRPGETNLAVRVFWGDGTVETFTGLTAGTHSFQHTYTGNPNTSDPAAPILVNAQVAHDPGIELRATNVNTSVRSITNSGVTFPPPVPSQNINADLSAAIYDSGVPDYAAMQPNVLSQPGDVSNPGKVIFQDTTLLATTVPVPGLGLAGAVFDTTPPVAYLTFPEASKVIDIQTQGVVQLAVANQHQIEMVRGDESMLEERVVILEVLSPDGSILQRVVMPETTLDDMHDVIGKLPDGGYRFLLKEPGEDRLRLLLEFEVRQGKIADESDSSDRPPSAGQKKLLMPENAVPAENTERTDPAAPNVPGDSIMQVLPQPGALDSAEEQMHVNETDAMTSAGGKTTPMNWAEWTSIAARLAWKRAGQYAAPADVTSHDDGVATSANSSEDGDSRITDHAAASLGVMAAIIGLHSVSENGPDSNEQTARLGRAARLFRKIRNTLRGESASKPKLRDEAF